MIMDIETLRRAIQRNAEGSEQQPNTFKDVMIDMSIEQIRKLKKIQDKPKK
jgi:hypothetical protein